MKIGIVSNLYPPQARGGAELVAQRVSDALYENRHDVFVLTTEPFKGVRSLTPRIRARHLGSVYRFFPFNFYYIRNDRFVPFPIRALWHLVDLFSPFARIAIRNLIKDERPDLIITHNLKGLGVSVGREIQRMGIPHIHVIHDIQLSVPSGLLIYNEEKGWLNRGFLRRWYEKGVRRSLGKPDLVISPSKYLIDFYKKRDFFLDSRVEVLPNPLPKAGGETRGGRVSGPTRFLFVGQLETHKGVMLMFDALESFGDDVELHIAGDGSLSDYVSKRALTDRRIHFHGFVSLGHLVDILQTTDAVLVPSTCYENSPTVIYEAFQVGVPVIASNLGGIPELIEDGKTGLLVEPANKDALIKAMQNIVNNQDEWWARTAAISEHAQKYTVKKYVKRLEELIDEILMT